MKMKSINRYIVIPKSIVISIKLTAEDKLLYATLLDDIFANETAIITENITDELRESLNRLMNVQAIQRWDEAQGVIIVKFELKEFLQYDID